MGDRNLLADFLVTLAFVAVTSLIITVASNSDQSTQGEQMAKKKATTKVFGGQKRSTYVHPETPPFERAWFPNIKMSMVACEEIKSRHQWMQSEGLGDPTRNAQVIFEVEKLRSLIIGGDGIVGDSER
ncbi:hypothetical protein [Kordiimonas sp.]|uniref:hypothetical protein n=1 Tax=Kordiimonas sp. TaxID=1970157 RepID=UPI003A8EF3FB